MTRRVLLVGLEYTGPAIPDTVIETRGLCNPQWFQLKAAAPLYEYDVIVIYPQSYSHLIFGEATEHSEHQTELSDLKREDNSNDIDSAFWRPERGQEMAAAMQQGTRVIWVAAPDKVTHFYGRKRSLYSGYLSNIADKVLSTSTLSRKTSAKLTIEKDCAAFTPYFEVLSQVGWNLCWFPGKVRDIEQVPLATTPEGYFLGSKITADQHVTWLLTPPPSAQAITALVQCGLALQRQEVEDSRYHGIFLSHTSEDKPFVRKLMDALVKHGVEDVWVDEAEIMIGDSLIRKIQEGITRSEYFGIILSPRSIRSEWVQRELEQSMTMEINSRTVKVLPLLYEPCEVPEFLSGKLYANFTTESLFEESLKMLLSRLEKRKP